MTNTTRQGSFNSITTNLMVYGALTVVALATVVVMAGTGHVVNTFMWVRGGLLPLIAVVLLRLAAAAGAGGSRRELERLRGVCTVMPFAIIGVDLIPGVCPLWYAVLQTVCMVPVIAVAVLSRRGVLRTAAR